LRALEHGRFDAVAVDLILTDSPGLTVVLACRSRRIPVVLLTPLDEADTLSRRLCPAGTPVVTKIARFDVIEQAISHAIMEKRLYQAAKPTDT
jgi:DNA-binding NarL/FixJ family response regulator